MFTRLLSSTASTAALALAIHSGCNSVPLYMVASKNAVASASHLDLLGDPNDAIYALVSRTWSESRVAILISRRGGLST